MRFWNKKSQSGFVILFYLLFGLILSGLFVVTVMSRIKAAVSDSSYHKKFYSRDLALLVDALHASNGDFVIKYDINYPESMHLDIALEPDRVIVTDHSDIPVDKRLQTSFRFGYNSYVSVIPVMINRTITSFAVVYDNHTITFKVPSEDVKLPEPRKPGP